MGFVFDEDPSIEWVLGTITQIESPQAGIESEGTDRERHRSGVFTQHWAFLGTWCFSTIRRGIGRQRRLAYQRWFCADRRPDVDYWCGHTR